MPDVGSVKYQVELDDSKLDQDISKTESDISSKLGSIGNTLNKQFGYQVFKDIGGAVVEAGKAMVGFAQDAVQAGQTFDASMSNVAAISGANTDELERLRDKALDMGAQTKFSASEAADAMSYMAMAGWKTTDMLDGVKGIMDLAAASGEDLALTSDIVTDALTGFGLTAKDAGHFADIMAAASSNANTNVALMGETFKYVAPVAGSLGVSAEDMAEAIGLAANAGIKGSQAGTSLRSILTRLATDAGASSKSLGALGVLTEELGVDFYDSEGKVRDFGVILDEARVKWQTLSDEDASRFAKKIAGQEGISAWLAIMNAAPQDIDKLRGAIDTCSVAADGFTGAADRMSKVQIDNLAGDITLMQSALETVKIAISDALTPTLREFVQFGSDALGQLAEAFNEGGLSGAVDAFGEILSEGITLILSKTPDLVKAGMELILALIEGIVDNLPEMLEAGLEILLTLVDGLIDNIPKLIDAGLKIVTALCDFLIKNSDKVTQKGVELIAALVKGLLLALPDIVAAIPKLIQAIWETFTNFNWLSLGASIIRGIARGIAGAAGEIASAAMDAARNALDAAKDFLGIHSPSARAAAEIGEPYAEGVAEGIDDGMNDISRSVELMGRTLTADVVLPDVSGWAGSLGAAISASNSQQITVVSELDGREIARGTAVFMNEQLAWEAR